MSYQSPLGRRVTHQLTGAAGRCYGVYWGRWPQLMIRWDSGAWEQRSPIGICISSKPCPVPDPQWLQRNPAAPYQR